MISFIRHAVYKIHEPRRVELEAWRHLGNWKKKLSVGKLTLK